MQKLLEGASTGKLHKIRARVQGPFGGHTLPVAEMDAPQHMIVFVGGVGAPTVLSILKRLASHRDANRRLLGMLNFFGFRVLNFFGFRVFFDSML